MKTLGLAEFTEGRKPQHEAVPRSRPAAVPPSGYARLETRNREIQDVTAAFGAKCLALGMALIWIATGCTTFYSHANRPLPAAPAATDCRGSLEIRQPRGEADVLMLLCLSGGGSRAAWFSAATMLRLENVVDEINLLREVDVISSVSGGSLPAAYYCVTRDPGPYSVVRVRQLPDRLPAGLGETALMDARRGLLGVRGRLGPEQREALLACFTNRQDRAQVEHLLWLSHHTHAPRVWQPQEVRDLMTRNYTGRLLWSSLSPLNIWEDILYWTTAYDRSDQMARIFTRNLFGSRLLLTPKYLQPVTDLEFMGYLDHSTGTAQPESGAAGAHTDLLRWPKAAAVQAPARLDWIPGYSPAQKTAQFIAGDMVMDNVREVTQPFLPMVPFRFKDMNPERPYLVLNATSGTEDHPNGIRFGEVFTFTREDFAEHLNSSIVDYDVSHAVMASAAFPGVFSFVTLRDYRVCETNTQPQYLHVFDGGNTDNLGLLSAKKIILSHTNRFRHFIVLLVDAHVASGGASRTRADPRTRLVDFNFMRSFGTLLDSVRSQFLDEFNSGVLGGVDLRDRLTFWQLTFDDVRDPDLRAKANQIPTDFRIGTKNAAVVESCVEDLIRPDSAKLQEILRVLRVSTDAALPDSAAGANLQRAVTSSESHGPGDQAQTLGPHGGDRTR